MKSTIFAQNSKKMTTNRTFTMLKPADVAENAVHGSDSDANAAIESAFHFSGREIF